MRRVPTNRLSVLALSAIAACATPDLDPDALDPRPPPVGLVLSGPAYVRPGTPITFTVQGAPSRPWALWASPHAAPGATCPSTIAPACLDLVSARLVGQGTTDATGAGTLTRTVPATSTGVVTFQASSTNRPVVSATVEVLVLVTGADTDGDGALDTVEVARGLDPRAPDSDGDGFLDGDDPWPLDAGPPASPFVPDEVRVTPASARIFDAEYDAASRRVAWQTRDGAEAWTADLDPATGAWIPADGRGALVARDVAPYTLAENGPEWVLTDRGSEVLVLQRAPTITGWAVATGWWDGAGWQTALVPGPRDAAVAYASQDAGDAHARFFAWHADRTGSWGELQDPAVGASFGTAIGMVRWVPGRRQMVAVFHASGGDEIRLVDVDTGAEELVASDARGLTRAYAWEAPEWGGDLAVVALRAPVATHAYTDIGVWRRTAGGWVEQPPLTSPPRLPWLDLNEPFVWEGHSYVAWVALESASASFDGPGEVWLSGLDRTTGVARRVCGPTISGRTGVEAWTGGDHPWVYFTKRVAGAAGPVFRCSTGI